MGHLKVNGTGVSYVSIKDYITRMSGVLYITVLYGNCLYFVVVLYGTMFYRVDNIFLGGLDNYGQDSTITCNVRRNQILIGALRLLSCGTLNVSTSNRNISFILGRSELGLLATTLGGVKCVYCGLIILILNELSINRRRCTRGGDRANGGCTSVRGYFCVL